MGSKILALCITILLMSFSTRIDTEIVGLNFEKLTIEEALEKATKSNKMVFIAVTATWCGTCKMMKKNVFPAKDLGDIYYSKFVCIEIDHSQTMQYAEELKGAQWETLPALIFMDSDGSILKIKDGLVWADELIDIANSFK